MGRQGLKGRRPALTGRMRSHIAGRRTFSPYKGVARCGRVAACGAPKLDYVLEDEERAAHQSMHGPCDVA